MSATVLAAAGAVVAAVALSLAPPLWWKGVTARVEGLPEDGATFTNGLLLTNLVLAGCVVLFVPGSPAVRWSLPALTDWLLIGLTPVGLLVVGGLFGTGWSLFGVEPTETDLDEVGAGLGPYLLAAVLVGPAEELLFRGLVQPVLVDALGLVPGVLAMSALFGLYHYPNVSESIRGLRTSDVAQLSLSGSGGLVTAALYVSTGNLVVPIVGHSLYVALLFVYASRQSTATNSFETTSAD